MHRLPAEPGARQHCDKTPSAMAAFVVRALNLVKPRQELKLIKWLGVVLIIISGSCDRSHAADE